MNSVAVHPVWRARRLLLTAALLFLAAVLLLLTAAFYPYPFAALTHPAAPRQPVNAGRRCAAAPFGV